MRFNYSVQGRLFRNLGDGARIVADDVELEQHALSRADPSNGWWFTVGVNLDASNQAEAAQIAEGKVETFLRSIALVGRDGVLAAAPFIESSGGVYVKPEDGPGQLTLSTPMLYEHAPLTPPMLADLQSKVEMIVRSSLRAGKNVMLAQSWYAQAMKRYGAAHAHSDIDRFMHLWVALDVLVPLGTGRDPFGNFKGRAQKYLRAQYSPFDPAKVDAILERLYRTRKLIFHEGDRAATGDNERIRLLVRDLIFKELALPSLDPLPATFF